MDRTRDRQLLNIKEDSEDTVSGFEFEPIRGYPMLNWKGKRPFRSTQYYPAQLKEVHGESANNWTNRLYWGDNIHVMSHLLKDFRRKVNLVYIDPPFDSKADYKKSISLKGNSAKSNLSAFEEKQYTDIWLNDEYLQFMYERLIIIKELMEDTGSIYLHCDYHKSHYLRCILDEVFGSNCFRSEVIWQRTNAHTPGDRFGPIHDTIFLYSKSNDWIYNDIRMPYREEYLDMFLDCEDAKGNKYARFPLTAKGTRNGETGRSFEGIDITSKGLHWKYKVSTLEELNQDGRIHWPKKEGGMPRLIMYKEDLPGMPLQDIWTDVRAIHNTSNERVDYPTQKPESLLERIILSSSLPGDIVFDAFMGAGTTQAVAMRLGRRFIGADINLGAIQTTTKRIMSLANDIKVNTEKYKQPSSLQITPDEKEETLECKNIEHFYTNLSVYYVNHYDVFRNPAEAKELLIEAFEIEKLSGDSLFDGTKDGYMVKIMPINRIATKADLNELVSNFNYKLFDKRREEHPSQAVEYIMLICMGHEPGLGASLEAETGYKLNVKVLDILRDKSKLEFKREAEAQVLIKDAKLIIEQFYPMNLLQKLNFNEQDVDDWRQLVETIFIDWNYDGNVLKPSVIDSPCKEELVIGQYDVPVTAGRVRIKITDLLSESLEVEVQND